MRERDDRALELKVPLKVDIAAGPNWLDVEPILDREFINNRAVFAESNMIEDVRVSRAERRFFA